MARKFAFSAETLLRARRQGLMGARHELAAAQADRDSAARQAASAMAMLMELNQAARQAIEKGTTGGKLEAYRKSVRACRAMVARRRARLAAAEEHLERCRRDVAERLTQRKVLETVRQTQLAAHERRQQRIETDQRDDEHAARTAGRAGRRGANTT
jgi:flagellar export protein FliJ